eukprot:TRINITY_DN476_c0_g1_i3.p1 TRINITY_DN476_c0_g1~~TRINITY_DN476_c0_g1_i3.p1  ORF type:complete len:534 (-),score=82.73 TRINITY_DN476_c0_g1_i3:1789-3390(-)
MSNLEELREENKRLRREVDELRHRIDHAGSTLSPATAGLSADARSLGGSSASTHLSDHDDQKSTTSAPDSFENSLAPDSLNKVQIERYGRQLIMSEVSVDGQRKFGRASVLVVGAGGLGSPVLLYLAAAGVGRLGVVDYDSVESGNLHRQVIHRESSIGISKATSAAQAVRALNSLVECVEHHVQVQPNNIFGLIANYEVVVDATDNVATRYLLNDACMAAGKVLVSGSALRTEGQLTVYGYRGGPCYRCLFPHPPPPETVTNCSDGGVLGVVPGIMGCLQAMEVLKVILGRDDVLSQSMLYANCIRSKYRVVRLRTKQDGCKACDKGDCGIDSGDGEASQRLLMESIADYDYQAFCGGSFDDRTENGGVVQALPRVTAKEYDNIRRQSSRDIAPSPPSSPAEPHILIDVRESLQYRICHLPHSVNIPLSSLTRELSASESLSPANRRRRLLEYIEGETRSQAPADGARAIPVSIYVICRRGIDSAVATRLMCKLLGVQSGNGDSDDQRVNVFDIQGGYNAWARAVDPSFPMY